MIIMTEYAKKVLKIAGDYQYHGCHIVRSFVSIPELAKGGTNGLSVKLTTADVPYTMHGGQKYINPNDSFNPKLALFVWMEGRDEDGVLCHWIVRFRLYDSNGFLRTQDVYQLRSLTSALTGDSAAIVHFDDFQMADNDPLPRLAAISRRLNSCRDATFAAADAIQQTTPDDPLTEKPKTYHTWAFKVEKPSVGCQQWCHCDDLEFLRYGKPISIIDLGSSLVDRLDYLHFSTSLSVVADDNRYLHKADVYTPVIDIEPIKDAGGRLYDNPGLQPADGFSRSICLQVANWTIRRGYDQLSGLWNSSSSWGGSPAVPGPDFWTYWPLPVAPTVPYFDDDNWKRTDKVRGYWRALPDSGSNLEPVYDYSPVVLPKIKAAPDIDREIDFKLTHEVRTLEKISGMKFTY